MYILLILGCFCFFQQALSYAFSVIQFNSLFGTTLIVVVKYLYYTKHCLNIVVNVVEILFKYGLNVV